MGSLAPSFCARTFRAARCLSAVVSCHHFHAGASYGFAIAELRGAGTQVGFFSTLPPWRERVAEQHHRRCLAPSAGSALPARELAPRARCHHRGACSSPPERCGPGTLIHPSRGLLWVSPAPGHLLHSREFTPRLGSLVLRPGEKLGNRGNRRRRPRCRVRQLSAARAKPRALAAARSDPRHRRSAAIVAVDASSSKRSSEPRTSSRHRIPSRLTDRTTHGGMRTATLSSKVRLTIHRQKEKTPRYTSNLLHSNSIFFRLPDLNARRYEPPR